MNKSSLYFGIRLFFFISIFFFFNSCKKSEENIEIENIENFQKIKPKLESSVLYIRQKYLINEYFKSHKVSYIIPNKSNYGVRDNIYYDKILGNLLEKSDIRLISLRDNTYCDDSETNTELFFIVNSKSTRQYYYVYRFCNAGIDKTESSLNYKVIPLNKNWTMDIEIN